ncbi:MAG: folate-binding protein [Actinomyces sp.]|nr:MAG: folate-binding protein [Actinomyces sp.]
MSPAAWAVRTPRDVVRVGGPDATTYLQGQLSQDLAALRSGGSAWTLALEPRGRVASWFRITASGDAWLCDLDAGHADALVERLTRFRLRVAVDIDTVTGWQMIAVRGPGAAGVTGRDAPIAAEVTWPGFEGIDLVGPAPTCDAVEVDPVWLERARVAAAFPRLGAEITPDTIPAEAGVVAASVSFTKGCYVGQELVARIDSRGGQVPRPVRLLVADAPVDPASPVTDADGELGVVTSAVAASDHRGRPVGLALAPLARRVGPGAAVEVAGVAARVVEPPFAITGPAVSA